MTDALRPMARQRLYEQVLDRLRQYVAEGGLRAGTASRRSATWPSGSA
ncbi:hypothetical protein SALBM217S_01675 [Streptomyces griseoloalbus]